MGKHRSRENLPKIRPLLTKRNRPMKKSLTSHSKVAPVVLFVYNRPDHVEKTIEALRKNRLAKQSDLFIFSDGVKKPEDAAQVELVRNYIKTIQGFKNITIVEREKNYGLANSIIDGVTNILNQYGKIIVLEDDLITSPYFLEFMNSALSKYENESRVMQVSGYMFPVNVAIDEDAFFLPLTTSWGWGTWKRAWEHFDAEAKGYELLRRDKKLRKRFNLDGAYDYYTMLEKHFAGKVDSWAVRWYLSVFIQNGFTLYPVKTLVANTGFDGSGTHSGTPNWERSHEKSTYRVEKLPESINVIENLFELVISEISRPGLFTSAGTIKLIFIRLRRLIHKIIRSKA
ncbi:MAG: glycosyltransferase [Leptospirales bacterium]